MAQARFSCRAFMDKRIYSFGRRGTGPLAPRRGIRSLVPVIGVLAFLLVCLLHNPGRAETGYILEEQKKALDLSVVEGYWREMTEEVDYFLPDLDVWALWEWTWDADREGPFLDFPALAGGLASYFFREVRANLYLMGRLVVLAVAAALMKNLQAAFAGSRLSSLVSGLIFLVLFGLALQSFSLAAAVGAGAITRMSDFTLAMLPLLLTLLASLGSLTTAAIFHPMVIFSAKFFSLLFNQVVFPLIFLAAVLLLVNHVSEEYNINRLGELFRDSAVFILTFSLTIFVGILALSGIAGAVGDGIGLRTAKMLSGVFIPVVGPLVADALDSVIGASLLLKNGLILGGTLTLFLMAIFPLLKIMAVVFIYKLSSAIVQPLGETALSSCLNTMAQCLLLIFGAVTGASLMFFLVIIMVMGAGNAAVMLR